MVWVAFVVFMTPEQCDAFVEKYDLQEHSVQQCSLWDYGNLAPLTSPRPMARPEEE